MTCCQAYSRRGMAAASSTTKRLYPRPRTASGSSRDHTSITPPVVSSRRFSCSERRRVTGRSTSVKMRHVSPTDL